MDTRKAQGEKLMTDLQFQNFKEEKNRREAAEKKLLHRDLLDALNHSKDLPEAKAKIEILLSSQSISFAS